MGFKNGSWSFFESSHGKGAPDGVGGALKRLGNHLIAHGNDIPDAKVFFNLLKEHSKIKLFYVTGEDIKEIDKTLPNGLTTIKGTRQIHQVVTFKRGKILFRTLSCFCRSNNWHQGKICNCFFKSKSVTFKEKRDQPKKKRKSCYNQIYSSSEEEMVPNKDSHEDSKENVSLEELLRMHEKDISGGVDNLEVPLKNNIKVGTSVLVNVFGEKQKKIKYSFAAVCTKVCKAEDDGDFVVMFLNKHNTEGTAFVTNEDDESPIDFKQVLAILPEPKMLMKGLNRVVYEFPRKLNVLSDLDARITLECTSQTSLIYNFVNF